ncbi:glycosyltransferase family 39 protein [Actinomadura nitritigenes]|uniref:glycosyltransferase family 39 protein n=1 Tax=Actinomadura nitritigenes TaxID=134602 RepID=UPI003D92D8D1
MAPTGTQSTTIALPGTAGRLAVAWPDLVIPGVVTLCMCMWRIGVPSYWRDESVSVVVGHSGLGAMASFVSRIDAVHGLYYLLMHLVTGLGTSEVITRTPSAVASGLAALGIAAIGRRLYSPKAGLYGGLLYGLLPITSRYGQEARQYALVSAGAVLAAYFLLRALEDSRPQIRWYAAYAGTMGLLGWLHLYALFLLPAHAMTAGLWRHPQWRRRHCASWGLAALAAIVLVSPLAVVAHSQEAAQVSWLQRPGPRALYDFGLRITGDGRVLLLVLVVAVVVGTARLLASNHRNAAALTVPWMCVPFTLVWSVSQAHPVYHPRYILYSVCALALLGGVALDTAAVRLSAGRPWLAAASAVTVLVVLALATLPAQFAERGPRSRPDDLRSLAATLRQRSHPGDAVLYLPADRQVFATAYAGAFARLNATALQDHETNLQPGPFRSALAAESRVWLVQIPPHDHRYRSAASPRDLAILKNDKGFRATGSRWFGSIRLTLYVRRTAGG